MNRCIATLHHSNLCSRSENNMTTSLKNFLENGKLEGNTLTVTLVKKISERDYIVGDNSGLAVFEYDSAGKELKIGAGIKLIKPVQINNETIRCNPHFAPIKTLIFDKIDAKPRQLQNLERKVQSSKGNAEQTKLITFEEIKQMPNGNMIQKVTFLVTKSSRSIQTASGVYQICGIKDIDSKLLSINLYDKFIDSLEVGKVYTAMKIKKFNLKKDGEYQARLSSTNSHCSVNHQERKQLHSRISKLQTTISMQQFLDSVISVATTVAQSIGTKLMTKETVQSARQNQKK